MIFATVGTQLAFDRLITAVDDWAEKNPGEEIIAQIGPSKVVPNHMKSFDFKSPDELRQLQEQCSLIIAHAGIGTILTALELGKPVIIFARDHERGEVRNGHQRGSLKQFGSFAGVYAADDELALHQLLDNRKDLAPPPVIKVVSSPTELVEKLRAHLKRTFKYR